MHMSATWPSDWPERPRGKDCPMFSQGRPDEDEHGIRIHAGRHSDAYLQRASRQLGYTVVMWRGRHVAEPTELSETEASGYWLEVLRVAAALQGQYQPVKMNYQTLGNAVPHLHTHLVPRFAHDPAPGRPLPFPEGERPYLLEDTLRRDAVALRSLV
jgi:diadenosine tetraphosphate (Ap4A) HIT family hydrolase